MSSVENGLQRKPDFFPRISGKMAPPSVISGISSLLLTFVCSATSDHSHKLVAEQRMRLPDPA